MPIIFHDTINKALDDRQAARARLVSFLDKTEPELVYWLHHIWNNQQRAITYKEIREMIMSGAIDEALLEEWHQDYSRFVIEHIQPLYAAAFAEAAKPISDKNVLFRFEPASEGIRQWTEETAAAFVTRSTAEQISAIRFVVGRAAQLNDMNVDSLGRVIRAMVGLNRPQAIANLNYYNKLIDSGMKEKKAVEKSIIYSHRQHRYRGHMIARTELAFAYNKGEHEGVKQAMDQGYMGATVKIWSSAGDDRVCDICKELDRRTHERPIDFDSPFDYYTKLKAQQEDIDQTPPAHPHCRCAVIYKEVAPPYFSRL